jgi:transcriptional regulator with XRE-family HTH domain
MENEMYTNAQLIRKLREDRAWSQEHLAAVAGLSARTIQRVEAENSASRETRMAIAAALGVELAQLNRVPDQEAGPGAAGQVSAAPAQHRGSTMVERTVWGLLAYVLVMSAFAYTLGKDMALRDSRNSKCIVTPAQCPGR